MKQTPVEIDDVKLFIDRMRFSSIIVSLVVFSTTNYDCFGRGLKGRSRKNICQNDSRLLIAVRCNDSSELLYCPPKLKGKDIKELEEKSDDVCSLYDAWASQATCQDNEAFQEVLPYYTGCYPKNLTFWSSFAPDLDIQSAAELESKVAGFALPKFNVANSDFEDPAIGISEWSVAGPGPIIAVNQKTDNFPRCNSTRVCLAHGGRGYAFVSAGETKDGTTPPNSLSRSDFRIPSVQPSACQTEVKFCFSFAMRFISKETQTPPSKGGCNDFFTVQIQVGEDGEMLYNRTIRSSDVEGFGDATVAGLLGDDSGWEFVEIELPAAPLSEPTFFTFRAMVTNVNDTALDSIGYIDSLKLAQCTKPVVV